MVDGSQSLCPVVIGTSTSPGNVYRLYVNGAAYATGFTTLGAVTAGSLSVFGFKSFDMTHPSKPGYRLRHRCIESPEARLIFEYHVDCEEGKTHLNYPHISVN